MNSTRVASLLLAAATFVACGSDTPTDAAPDSGVTSLQIVDLRFGTGASAENGKFLSVLYTAWTYDSKAADHKGTKLESNVGSTPYVFKLGAGTVIEGWDKGLPGLKAGGLRQLVVPPSLAYGSEGYGAVRPNETLIFEIELTEIVESSVTALQIQDLVEGTGSEAVSSKTASLHYSVWRYSETAAEHKGLLIETSSGGSPFSFTVGAGAVIKGVDQGVLGMKVGGKRRLTIPPSLAYGDAGSGNIRPNETLIFDLELVGLT